MRIIADPKKPEKDLEIDLLKSPFIRKPIRGSRGIR